MYTRSQLVLFKGMLWRYMFSSNHADYVHTVASISVQLDFWYSEFRMRWLTKSNPNCNPCGVYLFVSRVVGVGMQCVRVIQRWWRRLGWQKRAHTFCMAAHPRLGMGSGVAVLSDDLMKAIAEHM